MTTSLPPRAPWAAPRTWSTTPIPENAAVYDKLFAEYVTLHDYFGRGANDVMKRLKAIKKEQASE